MIDSNKIRVVILRPEGSIHAQCTEEFAETLSCAAIGLGYESCYTYNEFDPEATNIVLGWHHTHPDTFPPGSIIFNLEQFDKPNKHLVDFLYSLQNRFTIWDYSPRNIEILRESGITAPIELVRIGYVQELTRLDSGKEKDIDVLFYGSMNPRRKKVLHALADKGLKVHYAFGVYGKDRDALIERSKVVLNMHFYETSIFEMIRVSYLLANHKAVVAEVGIDSEIESDMRDAVLCSKYEDLVDSCLLLVNDYKERKYYELAGFETIIERPQSQYLKGPLKRRRKPEVPKRMNFGSGKNWRLDYLNVDFNPMVNPDIVEDLTKPLDELQVYDTNWFGKVYLNKGHFQEIIANDVLEHLPNLSQAMTNCLDLLEDGGVMKINVPYDLSHGAWQDPTHVRAFNERSWQYYTDWYWYMGWKTHRFELEGLNYTMSQYGESLKRKGQDIHEILRQPRAVDSMHVILKKRPLTVAERIIGDKLQGTHRSTAPIEKMDWRDIPVFIISHDRVTPLKALVDWLSDLGMKKIKIIDNVSTYQPLLNYYHSLPSNVSVLYMPDNAGPRVLWERGMTDEIDTPYIVTDSDLLPKDCPKDLIKKMLHMIQLYPECGKVGVSLRIDNLPDSFRHKSAVVAWESKFWQKPIGTDFFEAEVDTTFAIYPPHVPFQNKPYNIRMNKPYCFEHAPWYADEQNLSEEEIYYREHCSKDFGYWTKDDVAQKLNLIEVTGRLWNE